MAKYRKLRRFFSRVKTHYSKHKSGYGDIGTILGAMAYGAFRQDAANLVSPAANMLPFGNNNDEVVLGGMAYLLKGTIGRKIPMLKPVLKGALIVESARIGENIRNGVTGGQSTGTVSGMLG